MVKKNKFLLWVTLVLIGIISAIMIKLLIPKQSKTETNELYCFRITDKDPEDVTITYSLSSLTFKEGRLTREKELAVFDSSRIYSCHMPKGSGEIYFLTGDALFSFDLKGRQPKKISKVLWSSSRVLDWFENGRNFIYLNPGFSYDAGIAGIDESMARNYIHDRDKKYYQWNVLDAKIRNKSNDKEIIAYGIFEKSDREELEGILFSTTIEKDQYSIIKKDNGILNMETFVLHSFYETAVSIAISNDGEKVAYFADLDKRDSKDPDKEKEKKTAAWVVDLNKKAKSRFVTYADGVNGWTSWSRDDRYLIVSGRLFKVELWGYSEVKNLENLASEYKVLDRCSYEWSSDSDYFAFGNSLRENALYVTFLPDKTRTVVKGKTACFTWKK